MSRPDRYLSSKTTKTSVIILCMNYHFSGVSFIFFFTAFLSSRLFLTLGWVWLLMNGCMVPEVLLDTWCLKTLPRSFCSNNWVLKQTICFSEGLWRENASWKRSSFTNHSPFSFFLDLFCRHEAANLARRQDLNQLLFGGVKARLFMEVPLNPWGNALGSFIFFLEKLLTWFVSLLVGETPSFSGTWHSMGRC